MIQSENTFLVGYVIFDKLAGKAEVDIVKEASRILEQQIKEGELNLDPGVSYKFAGNYEQQERATSRLMIVVPLALLIVLLVLYFQFKTVTASLIHFSGVFVAFEMCIRDSLYTPDQLTTSQYFEDTPTIFPGNDAPGNIGTWIGWQIINQYIKETGSTPEALMQNNDAQEILTASKYKPL